MNETPNNKFAFCNTEQRATAILLYNFYTKLQDPYLGAIYVLSQKANPERFVQFSHSLREVIDLLTKKNIPPSDHHKRISRQDRMEKIRAVVDPLNYRPISNNSDYEFLVTKYGELSDVAHHTKTLTVEDAKLELELIGNILKKLTTPQTAIYDSIDDILSNPPSSDGANKLVSFCFTDAAVAHLVDNLSDDWLPLLYDAGFFNPTKTKKDTFDHYPWQPSTYLVKCAKKYPELTSKIILEWPFNSTEQPNFRIYGNFLSCATDLPATEIEKIAQKSLDENWYGYLNNHFANIFFMESLLSFIDKLFSNCSYMIASEIFEKAFTSIPNIGSDKYWYEKHLQELIPKLSAKNPILTFEWLVPLLEKLIYIEKSIDIQKLTNAQKFIGIQEPIDMEQLDATSDYSYVWRPTIEDSGHNVNSDVRSLLVSLIANCIVNLDIKNIDILKDSLQILYAKQHSIFRRIELFVYCTFPDQFKTQIQLSLLLYLRDGDAYREYNNLLKQTYRLMPSHIQEKILEGIDSGLSSQPLEKNQSQHDKEKTHIEEQWKFIKLSMIKDHLDSKHIEILAELEKVSRLDEYSDPPYYTVSLSQKPDPTDIFDGQAVEQVFEIIKNSKLSENISPFEDGTVITFGKYVQDNPLECSQKSNELKNVEPNFQDEFFSQLVNSQDKGIMLDWDGLIPLIDHILEKYNPEDFTNSFSLDPVLRLCNLLEKSLQHNLINFDYKDKIWSILNKIVNIGTAYPSNADYYLKRNTMNAFSYSRDEIDGMSFHAVYHYVKWCEKHVEKGYFEPEARRILSDYIDGNTKPTIARHAVIGFYFVVFYYFDKQWIMRMLDKIKSDTKLKIAFWESYVSHNKLYITVFDDLISLYGEMLNGKTLRVSELQKLYPELILYEEMPNDKTQEDFKISSIYDFTIDHTTLAYFYDFNKSDQLFENFLNTNHHSDNNPYSESPLNHCAFFIAQLIKDKTNDKEFNKEKLKKLWKHPTFLNNIWLHEWFVNSPLDEETTIKIYHDYLKRCDAVHLEDVNVGEFKKYTTKYPVDVASCIKLLVEKQIGSYIPDAAKEILQVLLVNPNNHVKHACTRIINHLAKLGYDYRSMLK